MSVLDDEEFVPDEAAETSTHRPVTRLAPTRDAPPHPERTPPPATLTEAATDTLGYLARTFGSPTGLRGLAVETVWCAAHLVSYPFGLLREQMDVAGNHGHYRTHSLSPAQRSLIVSDMTSVGTPVLLVHGLMDNRSVFAQFRRALREHGFGVVHAINYGVLTQDIRAAAYELRGHVNRLRERTGAERIHIVGHSLGGLVARYYVQRLGGDAAVHTVATLGTPHGGSMAAYLLPTPLSRQLVPGSDLLGELAEPAPSCRARFLVAWSSLDQLIVPRRNGRLTHPDLRVDTLRLSDAGHLSLSVDPRTVRWVARSLTPLDDAPTS